MQEALESEKIPAECKCSLCGVARSFYSLDDGRPLPVVCSMVTWADKHPPLATVEQLINWKRPPCKLPG